MERPFDILDLPDGLDQILESWQRAEIIKRVGEPIVVLTHDRKDPLWTWIDGLCDWTNLVIDLEGRGVECTVHRLGEGFHVAWVLDDHPSQEDVPLSEREWLLMNRADLDAIQDWYHL